MHDISSSFNNIVQSYHIRQAENDTNLKTLQSRMISCLDILLGSEEGMRVIGDNAEEVVRNRACERQNILNSMNTNIMERRQREYAITLQSIHEARADHMDPTLEWTGSCEQGRLEVSSLVSDSESARNDPEEGSNDYNYTQGTKTKRGSVSDERGSLINAVKDSTELLTLLRHSLYKHSTSLDYLAKGDVTEYLAQEKIKALEVLRKSRSVVQNTELEHHVRMKRVAYRADECRSKLRRTQALLSKTIALTKMVLKGPKKSNT